MWIEVHQELPHHPKMDDLMEELGVKRPTAVGFVVMTILFALQYAKDGFIAEQRLAHHTRGAGWPNEPKRFAAAMEKAGWWDRVEGGWIIHDWQDYAGKLIERRHADAARKRGERSRISEGPPMDVRGTAHVQNQQNQHDKTNPSARSREQVTEGSPSLRPAPKPRNDYPEDFESFWAAYPERRRVNKKAAADLFKRALSGGAEASEIMAGLDRWKVSKDWLKDNGEYVRQPDGWLRNRCWEDSPEPARTTSTGNPIGAVPDVPSPYAGKPWAALWAPAVKGTYSDQQFLEAQARRAFDKGGTCDVRQAMTLFKSEGVIPAMDYVWSHDPRNPVRAHVASR